MLLPQLASALSCPGGTGHFALLSRAWDPQDSLGALCLPDDSSRSPEPGVTSRAFPLREGEKTGLL